MGKGDDLYGYIRHYVGDHGEPPSRRQMASHLHSSQRTVGRLLNELAEGGLLEIEPQRWRSAWPKE